MKQGTLNITFSIFPVDSLSDSRQMIYRLAIVQTLASGCCDFIAQCIMVPINRCIYMNHPFIHLNIQRSTVVGFCGIKISVLFSFLH